MIRLNQKVIQTGKPKGTFSYLDPHPTEAGLVYNSWHKKNDRETWQTIEAVKRKIKASSMWNKKNSTRVAEKARDRYQADPEKGAAKRRKWVKANKQKAAQADSKYYSKNKHKYLQRNRARKIGLKNNPESNVFWEASRRISECLGVAFHVDHIKPLSKGGKHAPENLQIVPAKWNLSKSNNNNDRFPYNTSTTTGL